MTYSCRWLGTQSRRIFGNVVEKVVTICVDTSSRSKANLGLLKEHLRAALFEQVFVSATHFNILRFDYQAEKWRRDMGMFAGHVPGLLVDSSRARTVPVTEHSINLAWDWISSWAVYDSPTRNILAALKLSIDGG